MRVLILRPEPGNAATARAVTAMGLDAVQAPLFKVVPVSWAAPVPARFDAIVMTSANAARHGGPALQDYRHLPLYVVGEATAAAARQIGFVDIRVGTRDAKALAETIDQECVLHLAGAQHQPLGLPAVTTVPVYSSVPLRPSLPAADIALIHSSRAGQELAEVTESRSFRVVAISGAAAAACGPGWRGITVADAPREQAMLASLAALCDSGGNHG